MTSIFASTAKQTEIMTIVCAASSRGAEISTGDLRAALSWAPKLAAFHCSLKFLKDHGMLVVENHGRNGGTVRPTTAGYALFKPKPV
jgi:hypothetical protein